MNTYMLVGGGSGGHLTPLTSVAEALKTSEPDAKIIIVGQKGEDLHEMLEHSAVDDVVLIRAGKFRRYHGESFISHVLDVRTVLLNFRDMFRFLYGTVEAWRLLGHQRPGAIFLKGGFVSVPVGFAARLRKVPYITHDSDAIPGLANRLTARSARFNTTALPIEGYPYDQEKAVQVGIPLRQEFSGAVSPNEAASYKKQLGYNTDDLLMFVFGGGLGAHGLNKAVVKISTELLSAYPRLKFVHFSGKGPYHETKKLYEKTLSPALLNRVHVVDFHTDVHVFSGAADLVVARAGATSIAEFAVQAKPCIFVPNPLLTGGQQLHNADVLTQNNAAVIVAEGKPDQLEAQVRAFLDSPELRGQYAQSIQRLANPDAARKIADILNTITENQKTR